MAAGDLFNDFFESCINGINDQFDSWVYYIAASGTKRYKIGVTTNIERRMSDLQSHSPIDLFLVWRVPGGFELERAFHRKYKKYRIRHEWFEFPDEVERKVNGEFAKLWEKMLDTEPTNSQHPL